jgi:hypothetical protein
VGRGAALGLCLLAVLASVPGCAASVRGRATDAAQAAAHGELVGLEDFLKSYPELEGDELRDAAVANVNDARQSMVGATSVEDDGDVLLTLYIDRSGADGGGLFVTEASVRLCVEVTLAPGADPPATVQDAECPDDLPLPEGRRLVRLD